MLFNSYTFILLFLPLTVAVYFLMQRFFPDRWAKVFLLLASLFFMSFWNVFFALVLIASVVGNYLFGIALSDAAANGSSRKKPIFIAAITANIACLGFFKYTNFFIGTVNTLVAADIQTLALLLPIGISFYTFMQIAWLTDIYRHGGYRYDFLTYSLYITFFPYVISGPIAYHKEIIPQFESPATRIFNLAHVRQGLFIFAIGLFKKTAIADTLSVVAVGGYDQAAVLTFTEAWLTSLAYTMQIYFDFSAYTDMAIGAALIMNIRLPINFRSPYKALNILDFWGRWHLTLTRFLREYLYIPLGGNRKGPMRHNVNILLTFLIVGLWHGAAWSFVFWGLLNGVMSVIYRYWQKTGIRIPKPLAWFLFFNWFNLSVVVFRANTWDDMVKVMKGMAGLNGIYVSPNLADSPVWQSLAAIGIRFGHWRENLPPADTFVYFLPLLLIPFVLFLRNSNELLDRMQPGWKSALATGFLIAFSLLLLNAPSAFLYFEF